MFSSIHTDRLALGCFLSETSFGQGHEQGRTEPSSPDCGKVCAPPHRGRGGVTEGLGWAPCWSEPREAPAARDPAGGCPAGESGAHLTLSMCSVSSVPGETAQHMDSLFCKVSELRK